MGGGIYSTNNTLSLTNSTISNCQATNGEFGGGVYQNKASMTATYTNCTFQNNKISNSTTSVKGGAVYLTGTTTFQNCTFNQNSVEATMNTSYGGAIHQESGTAYFVDCTISNGSSAPNAEYGGGISIATGATAYLLNTSIINNSATNGADIYNNGTANAYYSWYNGASGNAIGKEDTLAPNKMTGYNANLGALAANGGATKTMATLVTSPANPAIGNGCFAYHNATDGFYFVDSGGTSRKLTNWSVNPTITESDKITTDQRGTTRLPPPTIGAYQRQMSSTQVVTSNADTGANSLREAVADLAAGGTITFNLASGSETITVASELAISRPLTINGANTAGSGTAVTIQVTDPGTSAWRALNLNPGAGNTANLSNLTIKGGDISGSNGNGGSIYLASGTLNLTSVTVSGSKAIYGGGIWVEAGTLTMSGSTISNSRARNGGGVAHQSGIAGPLNFTNCSFTSNSASSNTKACGGGALIWNVTATFTNCVFNGNTTSSDDAAYQLNGGGAICSQGTLRLLNCTFNGNSASCSSAEDGATVCGGAILNDTSNGIASIIDCTISGNSVTGGRDSFGGGVCTYMTGGTPKTYLLNTIVVNNTATATGSGTAAGNDIFTTKYGPTYAYYSWYNGVGGDVAVNTQATAPNRTDSYNANLGALASNGGATKTMATLLTAPTANPAISNGSFAYYNTTDSYYLKASDNTWHRLADWGTAPTNNDADKITTDQRGTTRPSPATIGAYQGGGSLSLIVNPASAGTVTAATSDLNVVFNIAATPATGYTFSGWTSYGNTEFGSASSASTTLKLTGDAVVFANFTYSGGLAVGWGANNEGELGNGTTTTPVTTPQLGMTTLTALSQIATGALHTLALKTDGTVWASGYNNNGQLGINNTTKQTSPVQVLKGSSSSATDYLTGVVQVAAGGYHSLAVKNDGTVWAWGLNDNGQLGDGTTINRLSPVQVLGVGGSGFLTGVVQVAAGGSHSLAVKNDGTVWAWGQNTSGQLGDNSTTNRSTPVQVLKGASLSVTDYLTGVVQICGGHAHSVAMKSDGTVFAWGNNMNGQLGDGTNTSSPIPVQAVKGASSSSTAYLTGVVQISVGNQYSMALKSDGTVFAWGSSSNGQLGDGTFGSGTYNPAPVQVKGVGGTGNLTGVSQVCCVSTTAAALKSDGTVYTWGDGSKGQLGDGSTTGTQATPVKTSLISSAASLGVGGKAQHVMVLATPLSLTMAVSPASSGTTVPAVGATSVVANFAQNITATPAASGSFVIWSSTGSATFDNSTSASTTVTLTGNSTVTANFLTPTQTVTTNADTGAGSLRQAIANLAPNGTITFNLPSGSETITLGSELAIAKPVTINGENTVAGGGSGAPITIQVTQPGVSAWRTLNLSPGAGKTTALSNLTIKGGNLPGNTGAYSELGGSIYHDSGTLNLTSVTVSGSTAYRGGGVYSSGDALSFTSSTIQNCSARNAGGGVCGGATTLVNSTIKGCSATVYGGGIYSMGGTLTITDSTIGASGAACSANNGGGVYLCDGSLTMSGSTISSSSAKEGGGFANDQNAVGSLTFTNCAFTGNSATTTTLGAIGGAAAIKKITATFTNCTFNGNTASSTGNTFGSINGGGALYSQSTLMLRNCTFNGNSASCATTDEVCGGAIINNMATGIASIVDCTISGNSVTGGGDSFGGGVCTYSTSNPKTYLLNSIVINNTASTTGSGTASGSDIYTKKVNDTTYGSTYAYNSWYSGVGGEAVNTQTTAPNRTDAYNANLSALASNGGATKTMATLVTAPAANPAIGNGTFAYYNATDNYYLKASDNTWHRLADWSTAPTAKNEGADIVSTDQRGTTRPSPATIGAYQGGASLTLAVSPASTGTASATSSDLSVANPITATAAANYTFANWTSSGNATFDNASSASTTVTLTGASTVTANFTLNSYTLTMAVSPASSGTTTPTGSSTVSHGVATNIAATAATGYTFANWTSSGNATFDNASAASTTVTLTGASTVTANFTLNSYTLTMAVSPASSGSTTPTGTTSVSHGVATNITATAATGYTFANWTASGNATFASSTSPTTTVTLTGTSTVTANFTLNSYTVTFAAGTGGSLTGQTSQTVQSGASCSAVTAVASTGYTFAKWTLAGADYSTSNPLTVTNVTASMALAAVFTANPTSYTVTFAAGSGGSLTGQTSQTVQSGASCSAVTAVADSGYAFTKWTKGGADYSTSNPLTVTNVTANMALAAVFTANPPGTYTLTVLNGTGSGSYASGTKVTITANTPATGKAFDKWTGDTSAVADITASSTTLTMPAAAATVTATYKDAPTTTYTVAFAAGEGGSLTGSTSQTVASGGSCSAVTAVPGVRFSFTKWTLAGADYSTANPLTVTSVATNMTLTAVFAKSLSLPVLTVVGGTANGASSGAYAAGEWVSVVANQPASGMTFDAWTGDVSTMTNPTLSTANFKMPSSNVTVTATYKTASTTQYALTVVNGSGSGSYTAGSSISIAAAAAPDGKTFDQWNGDKATIANVFQASTTMTMPSTAATVTAVYKDTPPTPTKKTLTMVDGVIVNADRSTSPSGQFDPGTTVSVQANAPPEGKVFNAWTGAAVAAWGSASTTLPMPNADATLTATYRDAGTGTVTLVVDDGDYTPVSLNIQVNTRIIIQAIDRTAEGFVFKRWTLFYYNSSTGKAYAAAPKGTQPGYIEDPYSMTTAVVNVYDALVVAEYAPGADAAKLIVTAEAGGTVDPTSGQTITLSVGEPQTIAAAAEYGRTFAGWTSTGGAVVADPTSAETSVTVSADGAVTATFSIVGVTSGSKFQITSTTGDFERPRATAAYEWRGKTRKTNCKINKADIIGAAVNPIWVKRVELYDRATVNKGLRDGSLDTDLGDPISSTVTAADKKTGASGTAAKQIVGPRITSVVDSAGAAVTSFDGMSDQTVTIKGSYFGAPHSGEMFMSPKGYVLINGPNGASFKRCSVKKGSFVYPDPEGRANRSPMETVGGDSELTVVLPKLKASQTFGDRVAIDNGVGLAVFTVK